MSRRIALFITAVIATGLGTLAGYQVPAQVASSSTAVAVQGAKSTTYAMNVVVSGVPFWGDTRDTWRATGLASKEVNTEFGGPNNTDAQKQIDEIEALLAKRVKGLVIAPADSAALTPVIDKAVGQGVSVITYLVDSPGSKRLTYVSSELESASVRAAGALFDGGTPTGDAIIVFAKSGNEEQEARRKGFHEFILSHPGLHLVGEVQDNYDEKKGAEEIKPLLIKYPNIKYIFGCHSRAAVGAVTAVRELGKKPGDIRVGGWDTDQDVLDLIKGDWVQVSVAQQSSFMTQMIFGILEADRLGYLYPANRSYKEAGIRPAPENIIVPVTVVNARNVAGFYPKKP